VHMERVARSGVARSFLIENRIPPIDDRHGAVPRSPVYLRHTLLAVRGSLEPISLDLPSLSYLSPSARQTSPRRLRSRGTRLYICFPIRKSSFICICQPMASRTAAAKAATSGKARYSSRLSSRS
jgi:hypothetical protein